MVRTQLPARWKFFVDRTDDEAPCGEWLLTRPEHVVSRGPSPLAPTDWIASADEQDVSRPHATFHTSGGRVVVLDCGSRYGTFVNGARMEACTYLSLEVGDVVRAGTLLFTLAPATAAARPPRKAVMARNGTPLRPNFVRVTRGPLVNKKLRLDMGPILVGSARWSTVHLNAPHYQGTCVNIEPIGGGGHRVVDKSEPKRLRLNGVLTADSVLEHLDDLEIGDFFAMTYVVYRKSDVYNVLVSSTAVPP